MTQRFIEHRPMGGYGTLNVVPAHVTLMAKCEACGAMRELDREALEVKAGAHCDLATAAKRLRCACGEKAGKILTGYYASE